MRAGHLQLRFLRDVPVDGIHENEFLPTCTFVTQPPPLKHTLVAEIVDFLNGTGHEFRCLRDAYPHGRARHAQSDFPIDGRGDHLDKPRLPKNRLSRLYHSSVLPFLRGVAHHLRSAGQIFAEPAARRACSHPKYAATGPGPPHLPDSRDVRDDNFASLDIKAVRAGGFFLEFGLGFWFAVDQTNANV
jgi:hypothetical protein